MLNKFFLLSASVLLVFIVFIIQTGHVHAKTLSEFKCMTDQLRTPEQKGLAIIGELSGFDPCNKTVEFNVPKSSKKPSLVISVHGGGGKKDAITITNEFYKLGYATLIFDAYDMNSIPLGKIGNAYRQMMLLKTSYAAYKWVLNRPEIDQTKIYFYGISNGASTVLNLAAMVNPVHVRGIISEAPNPIGIGYPYSISIPVQIIFGKLDDLSATVGKKRWEISAPCYMNRRFDFAPIGFSEDCRKGKKKIKMPTTLEWVKTVSKENNSKIDIQYIENMAHGGFLGPLNISTRKSRHGPIGWSEGGTPAAREKMMSVIKEFLANNP
jgi:dienelactone hydrolase